MNKQEILKKICDSLGESVDDFESTRLDEIKADFYTLKYGQRGIGGIIIGDDGSSLVCGSIKPISDYIEDFKNGERDSFEIKNRLTRKELADKFYGYHSINKINDGKSALDYLIMIEDYLNSYEYVSDSNFVLCGRKKFVYDEILDILSHKKAVEEPLYFVLGSLEEFMSNDNFVNLSDSMENVNKNDEYIKTGYICLEEKECIDSIILRIRKYIEE